MMEEGIFKCPKCEGKAPSDYEKWQKKNEKWIFYRPRPPYVWNWGPWWGRNAPGYNYGNSKECWHTNGGSTEKQWNDSHNNEWECNSCHYKSKSFIDFIPNFRQNN